MKQTPPGPAAPSPLRVWLGKSELLRPSRSRSKGAGKNGQRGLSFLLLGLALALPGCAGLSGPVEPPEVTLAGMGFGRPGLFEQELRVDLRVRNPNDFNIAFDSLRFDLAINELQFAQGRSGQNFELPALGETVVPVIVSVPTGDLVERVMQLGTEQRLDYRLTGVAELATMFGGAVPFEREGKLALPRIPGLTTPDV